MEGYFNMALEVIKQTVKDITKGTRTQRTQACEDILDGRLDRWVNIISTTHHGHDKIIEMLNNLAREELDDLAREELDDLAREELDDLAREELDDSTKQQKAGCPAQETAGSSMRAEGF